MKYIIIFLLSFWLISCSQEPVKKKNENSLKTVSLGPALTEQMFLLGAGHNLIGATTFCVRPKAAAKLPRIGDLLRINIELIYKLNPELVLATGMTRPENIQKLKKLGIKVVRFKMPADYDEICSQFLSLGKIFNRQNKAEEHISKCNQTLTRITNLTSKTLHKKAFFQIGDRPLYGAAADSYLSQYLLFSGCRNILAGRKSGAYSYERVLKDNPEVIITTLMGMDRETVFHKWERFQSLQAVQQEKILAVDAYEACSSNPLTFISTLKKITFFCHPDLKKKIIKKQAN